MKTSDFDFNVPEALIAHEPAIKRDESRLLVLDRSKKNLEHKHFYDIVDYLKKGDLLVLNDTRVIPARLFGEKVGTGAKIELLLISRLMKEEKKQIWKCLIKPGKRLNVGSKVKFKFGHLEAEVLEKLPTGEQILEFRTKEDFWSVLHKLGEIPLPPYIKTENNKPQTAKQPKTAKSQLVDRYQTVFAAEDGASAAPTAGLHFTKELLEKIKKKGVEIATVTLHTGLGTFLPVRCEHIKDHQMHAEYFDVPSETMAKITKADRVVAVGTTVVRALESMRCEGLVNAEETDLFIYPGYKFKIVDVVITNFHWPKSTLIMLVSAFVQDGLKARNKFAGRDLVLKAYNEAMKMSYRFFSFGDAMLIV